MTSDISSVRRQLSSISNVSQTWLEWTLAEFSWVKTLVVEVDFDMDPTSSQFKLEVVEAIECAVIGILADNPYGLEYLKIVPKLDVKGGAKPTAERGLQKERSE